jgi:hypothetical protein
LQCETRGMPSLPWQMYTERHGVENVWDSNRNSREACHVNQTSRGMACHSNIERHGAKNTQGGIRNSREVCGSSIMRFGYQVMICYSDIGIPCVSPDPFLIGRFAVPEYWPNSPITTESAGRLPPTMCWRASATSTESVSQYDI